MSKKKSKNKAAKVIESPVAENIETATDREALKATVETARTAFEAARVTYREAKAALKACPGTKGKKAYDLNFPEGKFTVKDLVSRNPGVTPATCQLHVSRRVKAGRLFALAETMKTGARPARIYSFEKPAPVVAA